MIQDIPLPSLVEGLSTREANTIYRYHEIPCLEIYLCNDIPGTNTHIHCIKDVSRAVLK
jgi:hypothetical protein